MATVPLRLACISGGYPVWALLAGQSQGLFEAHGLALEVTTTGSSVRQLQGLREGVFDIGLQLADHVVRASLEDCPMVVLAAQSHPPDVPLMAHASMGPVTGPWVSHRWDRLKGQPIGVDGARSGYALLLARLLRERGFAESEVRLIEVGGTQERADALRRGEVLAAFVNPPLDQPLASEGFVRLVGTREAFPDYPGPVVACRRAWAESHPREAAALQGAWGAAWNWLLDAANEEAALSLAAQHFKAPAMVARQMLQRLRAQGRPHISERDLDMVIALMGEGSGETTFSRRVSAPHLLWSTRPADAGGACKG